MLLALGLFVAQAPNVIPLPRDPRLFQEWVIVVTNGSDYVERLKLLPDGRFVARQSGREAWYRGQLSGVYAYGKLGSLRGFEVGDTPVLRLFVPLSRGGIMHYPKAELAKRRAQGQQTVPYRILLFDAGGPTLSDLIATIFAPKGQERRVKQAIEEARKRP